MISTFHLKHFDNVLKKYYWNALDDCTYMCNKTQKLHWPVIQKIQLSRNNSLVMVPSLFSLFTQWWICKIKWYTLVYTCLSTPPQRLLTLETVCNTHILCYRGPECNQKKRLAKKRRFFNTLATCTWNTITDVHVKWQTYQKVYSNLKWHTYT